MKLLALVGCLAVFVCLPAHYAMKHHQRRQAIEIIEANGGGLGTVFEEKMHLWSPEQYAIAFNDNTFNDKSLERVMPALRDLQTVEYLWLDGTQVTDSGIQLLADLRSLRSLSVTNTPVTDLGKRRLEEASSGLLVTIGREYGDKADSANQSRP